MPIESEFLSTHIPLFHKRFSLSYSRDFSCVEYFLFSREKKADISQNLILSHDAGGGRIYVSRFYPELYKEADAKYLSAACFYMLIRHAFNLFQLRNHCPVWLETNDTVFHDFYERLREFDFHIAHARPAGQVCLVGNFHDLPVPENQIFESRH